MSGRALIFAVFSPGEYSFVRGNAAILLQILAFNILGKLIISVIISCKLWAGGIV